MASWAKPDLGAVPQDAGSRQVPPPDLAINSVGRGLPRVEAPEGWVKKVERAREGKVWVGYFHVWETAPDGQRVRRRVVDRRERRRHLIYGSELADG